MQGWIAVVLMLGAVFCTIPRNRRPVGGPCGSAVLERCQPWEAFVYRDLRVWGRTVSTGLCSVLSPAFHV